MNTPNKIAMVNKDLHSRLFEQD